jgi:hypothetical protein
MELEGRPDGVQPHGRPYALDHYLDAQAATSDFKLNRDACKELFEESRCIYERYSFLLQIADFERVLRDTERNMQLFRFVHDYAEHPDDRENLQRWWPYVLRIHGTARAMIALRQENAARAIAIVCETRDRIDALTEVDAVEFRMELDRSHKALDDLEKELGTHLEPSPMERLEQELAAAVREEQYERAAELRDRLRAIAEETNG